MVVASWPSGRQFGKWAEWCDRLSVRPASNRLTRPDSSRCQVFTENPTFSAPNPHIFVFVWSRPKFFVKHMRAPFHFLLALLFLLCVLPAGAQNYKMHSVFVYSFTRYVIWPETYNTGDFEIMVLGDSPIIEELKVMAQAKKVGDRPIKITKISSPAEIKKCNMLFISSSKSALIPEVMEKINTQSVLVISEEAGAAQKGSDINFIVKDGKLAFELNQASVNRQGLKVSNELSRLAILI
jgi:hypothetical protein